MLEVPGSINALVQNFKSISTRRVNQVRLSPGTLLWQRDYYERILRDPAELDRVRHYINENPQRWKMRREEAQ